MKEWLLWRRNREKLKERDVFIIRKHGEARDFLEKAISNTRVDDITDHIAPIYELLKGDASEYVKLYNNPVMWGKDPVVRLLTSAAQIIADRSSTEKTIAMVPEKEPTPYPVSMYAAGREDLFPKAAYLPKFSWKLLGLEDQVDELPVFLNQSGTFIPESFSDPKDPTDIMPVACGLISSRVSASLILKSAREIQSHIPAHVIIKPPSVHITLYKLRT